jgi:folate/biopterin transporter
MFVYSLGLVGFLARFGNWQVKKRRQRQQQKSWQTFVVPFLLARHFSPCTSCFFLNFILLLLYIGVAISGTVAALLLSSACIAMSDVVADGLVVTRTREANQDAAVAGGLQSFCWGAAATGGLLSAYFSGSLLTVMSVRDVFGITAVLPLLVAIIALQMKEEPVNMQQQHNSSSSGLAEGVQKQVSTLWNAFKQPSIWRPSLFIFLWQSTPTADGAFFFFLSNDLGLGPEFMGRVRLVSSLATLVGVWLYNQYFKRVAIKDILFWSTLASFPLGLLPVLLITHANRVIGIPDQALIYGDDVVLAALGEIAFLPTLVLAARLCPPGIEAVLFATLMSIFNFASTVGTELGAALTKVFGITENNFDNLALLTVLCNLTSLYPLLFINWLDKVRATTTPRQTDNNCFSPLSLSHTHTHTHT